MPNMKQDELRKTTQCCACKKYIGQLALPIFWVVNTVRHGIDASAIQRHTAFEKMMGSPSVARAMGTDEDMTKVLHESKNMVCDSCMLERFPEFFDEKLVEETKDG